MPFIDHFKVDIWTSGHVDIVFDCVTVLMRKLSKRASANDARLGNSGRMWTFGTVQT